MCEQGFNLPYSDSGSATENTKLEAEFPFNLWFYHQLPCFTMQRNPFIFKASVITDFSTVIWRWMQHVFNIVKYQSELLIL